LTSDQGVAGSNPAGGADFFNGAGSNTQKVSRARIAHLLIISIDPD
jgi:hypothetical protein